MISPSASRRRAAELDALLRGAGTSARAADRHAHLLEVVDRLADVVDPAPRPEFVTHLRARLMTEAEAVLVPLPPSAPGTAPPGTTERQVRHDRRVAAALGTAALVVASGSVGVASQAALPGELLYPVKSVLESAREQIATGDQDKGMLVLSRAESRLDELDELVTRDDDDSRRATAPTLDSFADQAREAGDLLLADFESSGRRSSVLALRDFAAASMPRLEALSGALPAEARDELEAAAEALLALDDQALAACPDCGGDGVVAVPRFLAADGAAPAPGPTGAAGVAGPPERGTDPGGRVAGPGARETGRPPRTAPPSTGGLPTPAVTPPGDPSATPTPRDPAGPPVSTPPTPSSSPVPTARPKPSDTPQAPEPTPPATPAPPAPTPTGVVEGLTEVLVGGTPTPGSTAGATPSTGVLGGVGEVLEGLTGTLLGTPVGEAVEETTEGVRGLLGGVLRGPGGRPNPTP